MMDQSIGAQLRVALKKLKAGKSQEARKILVEILKQDSEVEQAWYMLSFAVPNEERQVYALKQSLRVNPQNDKARDRYEKLTGEMYLAQPSFSENLDPVESAPVTDTEPEPEAVPEPKVEPQAEPGPEPDRVTINSNVFQSESPFVEGAKEPEPVPEPEPEPEPAPESKRKKPPKEKEEDVDLLSQRLFGGGPDEEGEPGVSDEDDFVTPSEPEDEDEVGKKKKKKKKKKRKKKEPKERKGLSRRAKVLVIILLIAVLGLFGLNQFGIIDLGSVAGGGNTGGVSDVAATETTVESTSLPTSEPTGTPAPTATEDSPTDTPEPSSTATEEVAEETATSGPTATNEVEFTPTPEGPLLPKEVLDGVASVSATVERLRGLEELLEPETFLVPAAEIRQVIQTLFGSPEFTAWAEDEKRVYTLLGLIDQTYSMKDHALNKWAERQGGFYNPDTNAVYFTGLGFGGAEKNLYALEYDLALIDQNHDYDSLGIYPLCINTSEECAAMMALLKGDAALIADQWLAQASGTDRQDVNNLPPQQLLISGVIPPPFALPDQNFQYQEGKDFVKALFNSGGWGIVDSAYDSPPTTTEQILHPEKYLAGEKGEKLSDEALSSILDNNWEEIKNESLGEWLTYLILTYLTGPVNEVDIASSELAAAGWGGDLAQVYFNNNENKILGAFHWVWDTPVDSVEFSTAFLEYLDSRYASTTIESESGAQCWEGIRQISCFVSTATDALWVVGSSQADVELVLGTYGLGD